MQFQPWLAVSAREATLRDVHASELRVEPIKHFSVVALPEQKKQNRTPRYGKFPVRAPHYVPV
jgi:hypothetical protein